MICRISLEHFCKKLNNKRICLRRFTPPITDKFLLFYLRGAKLVDYVVPDAAFSENTEVVVELGRRSEALGVDGRVPVAHYERTVLLDVAVRHLEEVCICWASPLRTEEVLPARKLEWLESSLLPLKLTDDRVGVRYELLSSRRIHVLRDLLQQTLKLCLSQTLGVVLQL